jgi:ABC-type sulfate transport system substrate-binding protein
MKVKVDLNKSATIIVDHGNRHQVFSTNNVADTIESIRTLLGAESIQVSWKVCHGAPVSIDKQNATMMKRAQKIATALGFDVASYSQIDGVSFGFDLA